MDRDHGRAQGKGNTTQKLVEVLLISVSLLR